VTEFHAATFELLDLTPVLSPSAVAELDRVEKRIGRKLPASVREWYSIDGACRIMREYSNDDPPIPVNELGSPRRDTRGGGPVDLISRNLVPFRYENQAVCIWAFRIDGTDDPPVEVDLNTYFRTWTPCGVSFSQHLYASTWDFACVLTRELLVQAQNRPLTTSALGHLQSHFTSGPTTFGWPGHTQYRFNHNDKRILIWASDRQADWWLSADNEESLGELLSDIRSCDSVGKAMWSHSERGSALLELRRTEW
jgi:hypothetical protein